VLATPLPCAAAPRACVNASPLSRGLSSRQTNDSGSMIGAMDLWLAQLSSTVEKVAGGVDESGAPLVEFHLFWGKVVPLRASADTAAAWIRVRLLLRLACTAPSVHPACTSRTTAARRLRERSWLPVSRRNIFDGS
jgi:hypothetical protein